MLRMIWFYLLPCFSPRLRASAPPRWDFCFFPCLRGEILPLRFRRSLPPSVNTDQTRKKSPSSQWAPV